MSDAFLCTIVILYKHHYIIQYAYLGTRLSSKSVTHNLAHSFNLKLVKISTK